MLEALKHILGICGEHSHPSLLTLVVSGVGFTSIYGYIKYKYFIKKSDK
jgi:hypothetical protein